MSKVHLLRDLVLMLQLDLAEKILLNFLILFIVVWRAKTFHTPWRFFVLLLNRRMLVELVCLED